MLADFQNSSFKQRDAWLSIIACFILQKLIGYSLIPAVHHALPSLSMLTLCFIATNFLLFLPLIYFSFRYKRVCLSDLLLKKSDFIVLSVALVILYFIFLAFFALNIPTAKPNYLLRQTISQLPWPEYFVVIFAIFLGGPLLEETLFRKYIFEIFRDKYNILIAILFTSFSETFLHLGWGIGGLIPIFFWTTFFTLVYLKSRLGASVIIHGLTNLLTYFISWR